MSYQSPYAEFVFKRYDYDKTSGVLTFEYGFDDAVQFQERVHFETNESYDDALFDRAVFMAFVLAGISYYKCYPTKNVRFDKHEITRDQADFFTNVYRNGLSQFVYENGLSPEDIVTFKATTSELVGPLPYGGNGIIALQSGGKDSLLLARLLEEKGIDFSPWYVSQVANHPTILDSLPGTLITPRREIDRSALTTEQEKGALNGHVPVTFITPS